MFKEELLAYFLMKPSGGATPFSRHLWSHGIALAATVGFKGVEIVMGSVRNRKKFRSARSQVGHLKLDITYPLWRLRTERNRRGVVELVGGAAEHGASAAIPTRECSWPPTSTAKFR